MQIASSASPTSSKLHGRSSEAIGPSLGTSAARSSTSPPSRQPSSHPISTNCVPRTVLSRAQAWPKSATAATVRIEATRQITADPDAAGVLEAAGVADRCEAIACDFFGPLPAGGDVYMLRNVIPDWPDREAVTILRRCAEAAGKTRSLPAPAWLWKGLYRPTRHIGSWSTAYWTRANSDLQYLTIPGLERVWPNIPPGSWSSVITGKEGGQVRDAGSAHRAGPASCRGSNSDNTAAPETEQVRWGKVGVARRSASPRARRTRSTAMSTNPASASASPSWQRSRKRSAGRGSRRLGRGATPGPPPSGWPRRRAKVGEVVEKFSDLLHSLGAPGRRAAGRWRHRRPARRLAGMVSRCPVVPPKGEDNRARRRG
ncbi:MAG: methyltransferase [Acidimicrobiales bacterium]